MPVTLEEARINVPDDVTGEVIDEFRKSSWLLDNLTFDDVVSPVGNGGTLTYSYSRVITQAAAAFRAINAEYTPGEATKAAYSVDLKPLGGTFQIDRVLARLASQETAFQMTQKIKATRAAFADAVINGDTGTDANSFDGLDQALAGSSTELNVTSVTDWTGVDTEAEAHDAIDIVDQLLGMLDDTASAMFANKKLIAKIRSIGRRAGYYSRAENAFGQVVETFNGVPFIDLGAKAGSSNDVIPIESRDLNNAHFTGDVTGTPTGGTFTLTVNVNGQGAQTTAAIAYNATPAAVQSAIEALSHVGAGNVTVVAGSGVEYDITFTEDLYQVPVTLVRGTNGLTGGTSPDVTIADSGSNTSSTGLTDLYVVRLGLDGFHAVSMSGAPLVQQWLPDFTTAGAVKTGEVELGPAAVALKATKAAAVYRNIKVQ